MSITRRQFLVTTSAGVAAAAWPLRITGQQAQGAPAQPPAAQQPVYTFTAIRNDVGIFTGQGGTIGWLVSPDGVVVVDAQMGAAAAACLAGIKERGGNRVIDLLFNTHHHGDHTGGNPVFRPATKKIVAHANVPALQKAAARPGTEADQIYADSTFTDAWSQPFGKERVTAAYYGAAHTGGDSVVTFERANVVHLGDLVFNRRMPVTDRPGGCRIAGWITVLDRIVKAHQADTLYIFGHGKAGLPPTGSKADVLLQRDFLAALLDHVRGEIKAGKDKDAITKASPQLKNFLEHGALTERVLTAAYDEVAEGSRS
jgi:glyoxylase-like metal-dependent hydrolase (beta-lactamase superfamily II)